MAHRNLRKERELRELSRNKVAEILGIRPQSLATLESGKTDPSYRTLKKIEALYFPLKHDYLFSADPETKEAVDEDGQGPKQSAGVDAPARDDTPGGGIWQC
jgi:transcriptional regulator with XRE-family HTH domain